MANVLDLHIKIISGKFDVSVYDKRDYFPFQIVQFSSKDSNIPRSAVRGVFLSQVIRYFRICHNGDGCIDRLSNIELGKFKDLWFSKGFWNDYFLVLKSLKLLLERILYKKYSALID